MAEYKGIKETNDAVEFVGVLSSNLVDAAKDGKFEWLEALKFRESIAKLPAAINGYKEIPAEIADLDEYEAQQLRTTFANALDIPGANEQEELLVEDGVGLALQIIAFVGKVRDYRAKKDQATA